MKIFKIIQKKFDWWVYKMFHRSIVRMEKETPGIAYLIELWITDYYKKFPLPDRLKELTEEFFETRKPHD